MQTNIFYLNNSSCEPDIIDAKLSFEPFFRLIQSKKDTQVAVKAKFYHYILDRFALDPAFTSNIKADDLKDHQELLELIYATLSPIILDDTPYLWALSTPVPYQIIYSTDAFFELAKERLPGDGKVPAKKQEEESQRKYYSFVYRLILKKLYHLPAALDSDIFHTHQDPETKLSKYYQINVDTSFIDVEVKGDLPELNTNFINSYLQEDADLAKLAELLPLNLFKLTGFSVITLTDVTVRHAIDELRNAIVEDTDDEQSTFPRVVNLLKSITGDTDFEFGLLPFIQINGQDIFDNDLFEESVLIQSAQKYGIAERTFQSLLKYSQTKRKAIFFSAETVVTEDHQLFVKVLSQGKVLSFAGIPLFYNKQIVGILEVYSFGKKSFPENVLLRLEYALPLLAQLVHNGVEHYKLDIDHVIQESFTALQTPVLWKFYEAAWNYLKAQRSSTTPVKMETVCFDDVYPLYGAVDTRDSTIARNIALQQDLKYILNRILELFGVVKTSQHALLKKLHTKANELAKRIAQTINAADELKINQFMYEAVLPFLIRLKDTQEAPENDLNECISLIETDCGGLGYKHRGYLEESMQMINTSINQYLEKAQRALQAIYPCYFEKFRTDGIEYDIYIGQSITPKQEFDESILSSVRLWQLTAMAEIAQLTHGLQKQMTTALQTTQLIFINSNTIAITFRNDERRFDVEGIYNIRYEVIKKRIDKVLLKDKSERLTQPGKIALVYFTVGEATEYEAYIKQLQQQKLLANDLEHLNLEELQGVKGLKALRVGVVLNN
jgi:hypothetical protein